MWLLFSISCLLFESGTIIFPASKPDNSPPVVTIDSPTPEGRYYSDHPILLSATIFDEDDLTTDLTIEWHSDRYEEGIASTTADESGRFSEEVFLSSGVHQLSLSVTDPAGNQTIESVDISVGAENQIPECTIQEPSNAEYFVVGDEISFRGTATDNDITNPELRVEWLSDQIGSLGFSTPDEDGNVAFSTNALEGTTHQITMQVSDELGAECIAETSIVLRNPPQVSILSPMQNTIDEVGDGLLFEAIVSDLEDTNTSLRFAWISSIDGILDSGNPDSDGKASFVAEELSIGRHEISLSVTDSDGLISTDALSLTITEPPVIDTVVLSPSSPSPLNRVECTPVLSNENLDTFSFEYHFSNPDTGQVYAQISNDDSSAVFDLSSTNIQLSDVLECQVTVSNGLGATATASNSVTLNAESPYFTMPASITPSTNIITGTTLTCQAEAELYNQETILPSFQWFVNEDPIGFVETFVVDATDTDPEDIITCEATASAPSGFSHSSSSAVIIENSAPVIDSIGISPSSPSVASTLVCSVSATDIDDDGDDLTYSFSFENQRTGNSYGEDSVSESSSSLALSTTSAQSGDVILCSATVSDGIDSQTENVSITIQ